MKTGKRQILAALLCLLASALFVAAFSLFVKQIQPIPETQGKIEQVFLERNEETGELTQKKITSVLGKDVTAVRLSELTDLGALTKVNYVPGRFIQPTEIPADNQIVDLTGDFEFAEKGTLFFVVMNLDPSAEDFSEQVQRLERYKAGDYWHFTISLPQIFSACNIYMNSQLIASHGEIEDYNFIDFTTSYDKLTENFSAETGRTVVNLSFYTRREAISDDWASARVLCIHYQSNGGFYSGARDSALLGSEEAILSTGQVTRLVLMGGCVLSAMVFAVLTVLSALRRTTNFFPELIMVAGTLTVFLARYCFATSSAAPLFWISASRAAIFLLLGAAIYSVGKSRKTVSLKTIFAVPAGMGAILAFCLPYVSFSAVAALKVALTTVKAVSIVSLFVLIGIAARQRTEQQLLKTICAALIAAIAAVSLFLTPVYPVCTDPSFWLYAAVIVAVFVTVFRIFSETEKSNAYLTTNLNLEVERQVKDIRSVVAERDNLLQFVSHDMKKPLSASAALLDTLIAREQDAEQRKTINIIKQNTNRVLNNLTDIAAYSRFNYIAEPSRTLDLEAVCSVIYKYCSADCEACGIILKNLVSEPLRVFAKQQGLENAASNIILNAVEHAECTEITLEARADRNKVHLFIIDNGKGIAQDIDVFKPYVSENKPDTGGLGLYLCKNIVESMNGTLTFSSRQGKTAFIITLLKA